MNTVANLFEIRAKHQIRRAFARHGVGDTFLHWVAIGVQEGAPLPVDHRWWLGVGENATGYRCYGACFGSRVVINWEAREDHGQWDLADYVADAVCSVATLYDASSEVFSEVSAGVLHATRRRYAAAVLASLDLGGRVVQCPHYGAVFAAFDD